VQPRSGIYPLYFIHRSIGIFIFFVELRDQNHLKGGEMNHRTLNLTQFVLLVLLFLLPPAVSLPGCSSKIGLNSGALQHSFPSPKATKIVVPPKDPAGGNFSAKLFFANSQKDPEDLNPEVTYPVEISMEIEKDDVMVKKMIQQLVQGPPGPYKEQGYYTSLPSDTQVKSVKISDDTLTVDFSESLNEGGGSSMMDQRRSQIENTLRNIPGRSIKKVVISVNGDTQNVLQP
jgi:hypothetical protein